MQSPRGNDCMIPADWDTVLSWEHRPVNARQWKKGSRHLSSTEARASPNYLRVSRWSKTSQVTRSANLATTALVASS